MNKKKAKNIKDMKKNQEGMKNVTRMARIVGCQRCQRCTRFAWHRLLEQWAQNDNEEATRAKHARKDDHAADLARWQVGGGMQSRFYCFSFAESLSSVRAVDGSFRSSNVAAEGPEPSG